MTDLGLNFEGLRISTFLKAIKVSKSVETLKNSTLNNNKENTQNTLNINDSTKSRDESNNIISKSTRADVKFSIKKMLLENERQRQATVRQALDKRKQVMEKNTNEFQQNFAELKDLQAAKRERELIDECKRIEKEKEQAQQEEIERSHKMKFLQQRCEEKRKSVLLKLEREAEEQLRVQEHLLEQKIEPLRLSFHDTCRDIAALSEIAKDKNSLEQLFLPHTERLKGFHQDMEAICEIARCGELTDNDVKIAEDIVKQSVQILDFCKAAISKINDQYDKEIAKRQFDLQLAQEQVLQEQQQQQQQQQQQHQHQQQQQQHQQFEENPPDHYAPQDNHQPPPVEKDKVPIILQNQSTIRAREQEFIDNYMESFKDFEQSVELKKFRLECKHEIGILCSHLHPNAVNIVQKVLLFFRGHGKKNINQYPQTSEYCKFRFVQSIYNIGKQYIVHRPHEAAFIANLVLQLWTEFPDIGNLLLSYFRANMPLIIPEFHREFQELCHKNSIQISGVIHLYSAIIVCDKKPHPHGPENAWRWLTTILNTEVGMEYQEVTALMIRIIIEVVGPTLWRIYPKQFPKLLSLIVHQYYPKYKIVDNSSPEMERLLMFVEKCLQNQRIMVEIPQLNPN